MMEVSIILKPVHLFPLQIKDWFLYDRDHCHERVNRRVQFFQSTGFLYFTNVVAAIHFSMDTVFFRRAFAAMNSVYSMYLTDISI